MCHINTDYTIACYVHQDILKKPRQWQVDVNKNAGIPPKAVSNTAVNKRGMYNLVRVGRCVQHTGVCRVVDMWNKLGGITFTHKIRNKQVFVHCCRLT